MRVISLDQAIAGLWPKQGLLFSPCPYAGKPDTREHLLMGHARAVARSPRRVLIVAVPPVRTLDLFGAVMDRTRINRRDLRVGTTAAVVRFFDSVGRLTLPQTPAEANPSADTLL